MLIKLNLEEKEKKTVVIGIFILIIYYTVIDDSDNDDVFDIKPTKKRGDTKMEMENWLILK